MADIPREISKKRDRMAFLASMGTIALMMALFAGGMFPYLVLSNPDVAPSLTTANAASSEKTLAIMLVIALIGMPMVIAYTVSIYWIFRGKVKISSTSY
jgi:cytochrome d ubiquinol oxidase subunit II